MDWQLAGLANLSAVAGVPGLWAWAHDAVEPTPATHFRSAGEQSLDVRLIEIAYGVVASQSECAKCGAPLDHELLVTPSEHPPWTESVVTRCSGWQRHVHVATADEVSDGLMLGPFRSI